MKMSVREGGGLTILRGLDNGLSAHAARLGSKVDALSRALCDVAGSVSHKGHSALGAPGPGVLWDGVCLYPDDLSALCLHLRKLSQHIRH